jgi:hypothetical protein
MKSSDTIKAHIEAMLCHVHDIHPIVENDLDGIKIICCCEDFHKACLNEYEGLVSNNKLSAWYNSLIFHVSSFKARFRGIPGFIILFSKHILMN